MIQLQQKKPKMNLNLSAIKIVFITSLLFLLSGCATKVVVQKEYILVKIPSVLLEEVKVTPPPSKEAFLFKEVEASQRDKKRLALSLELNHDLYTDLKACNGRLASIAKLQSEAEKKIKERNEDKK